MLQLRVHMPPLSRTAAKKKKKDIRFELIYLSDERKRHQAGGNSWQPGGGRGGNIV